MCCAALPLSVESFADATPSEAKKYASISIIRARRVRGFELRLLAEECKH